MDVWTLINYNNNNINKTTLPEIKRTGFFYNEKKGHMFFTKAHRFGEPPKIFVCINFFL